MKKRNDVGAVFDFDGTLVPGHALMGLVDSRAAPAAARPELEAMRAKYLKRLHDGRLHPGLEREWFTKTMELYSRHGLSMEAAHDAVKEVVVKPCVASCLRRLHDMRVPVAIVSFGVEQFIAKVLMNNADLGRFVDRVSATRLIVGPDAIVTGYEKGTLVTPSLKGRWSRRFAVEMGVPFERLLAVGDTPGDRFLGSRRRNRLGLAATPEAAEKIRPHMGDIIVADDFCSAAEWLYRKIGSLAGSR